MVKIIFMALTINHLDPLHPSKFRKNESQDSGIKKQTQSFGRPLTEQDFVELIGNPLHGDNANTLRFAAHGLKGFGVQIKSQLSRKAGRP